MAEKIDDLTLPNSIIVRLVKEAVPEGVNLSKDARVAFSRAASVFVLFATSSANNFALKAKRKTLTGADVVQALEDMQFEGFIESVKKCYEAFRQEKGKKESLGTSGKGRKRKEPESVGEAPEEIPPSNPAENGHASGGEASED